MTEQSIAGQPIAGGTGDGPTAEPTGGGAPAVTVVIVSHNTAELTARAVRSVFRTAGELPVQVIVVDNGSTDGSADAVRRLGLGVEVDEVGANIGFGAANNRGVTRACAPHVLFLNPDAELLDGAMGSLVAEAAACPGRGFYSGLTERSDGTINYATVRNLPSLRSLLASGLLLSTVFRGRPWADPEHVAVDPSGGPVDVEVVTASLLLVDRALFERLGGFDERIFLYSEEVDLFRRAAAVGAGPRLVPAARICHDAGQATPRWARRQALMMAGRTTYVRLAFSGWRRRVALAALSTGVAGRAVVEWLQRGPRRWRAVWAARDWWSPGYLTDRAHPLDGLDL